MELNCTMKMAYTTLAVVDEVYSHQSVMDDAHIRSSLTLEGNRHASVGINLHVVHALLLLLLHTVHRYTCCCCHVHRYRHRHGHTSHVWTAVA